MLILSILILFNFFYVFFFGEFIFFIQNFLCPIQPWWVYCKLIYRIVIILTISPLPPIYHNSNKQIRQIQNHRTNANQSNQIEPNGNGIKIKITEKIKGFSMFESVLCTLLCALVCMVMVMVM